MPRLLCSMLMAFGAALWMVSSGMAQERPPLQVHQGQYFLYVMPPGWNAHETINGLDMTAPDGLTAASFTLQIGTDGQTTPDSFIGTSVAKAGYARVRTERHRDLADQPGPLGQVWRVSERQISFSARGIPMRALLTCGVIQGAHRYDAVLRVYQAPVRNWARARFWLPAIAESVAVIDAQQIAGLEQLQLPHNIPHDEIYDEFNRAWQAREVPHDRLSQVRRETSLGYERLADPATGELYDVPLELYDARAGGYRNPRRPLELLVTPTAGR